MKEYQAGKTTQGMYLNDKSTQVSDYIDSTKQLVFHFDDFAGN